jgi:hypothetical protein
MTDKQFRLDNFKYRLSTLFPELKIQCGEGSSDPSLVIIQDDVENHIGETKFVLEYMKLEKHSYIVPLEVVKNIDLEIQLYYLRELLDLLNPLTTRS